jgi:DNA-binding PadR family transcriptional regulator
LVVSQAPVARLFVAVAVYITVTVYDNRNMVADELTREIRLALWKVHILHHAAERRVYGQWIIEELRRHGYDISPGTLYPLLRRMERLGWLQRVGSAATNALKARQDYTITELGANTLAVLRENIAELHRELQEEAEHTRPQGRRKKTEAPVC